MKLSDLPTYEEALAEHLDADPEYRREWERTALARAVVVKGDRLTRRACRWLPSYAPLSGAFPFPANLALPLG
jgi:hypothetical protein